MRKKSEHAVKAMCQNDSEFPTKGRIAGIDFGTIRVGIAISDPQQTLASPHQVYARRGPALDREFFLQLAQREQLVGFVVGLPIHLSGDESQISVEARRFGGQLASWTSLPVRYFDERFTSSEAEALLRQAGLTSGRRKKKLDKLAAQIVLTAYLESARRDAPNRPID